MRGPLRLVAAVLVAAVGVAIAATRVFPHDEVFVRAYDHVLGTSLDLKILASSEQDAERAATAVLTEIDRQAAILSGYDPASEFSHWTNTRETAVPVSAELFGVLQRFDTWRDRTDGALDAAAETVSRVWKAAEDRGRLPADQEVADAVARVRQSHWHLDAGRRTATHLTDAPLVLNSFAKSDIVDAAASAGLASPGVRGIVVNIGGDLVVRGDMVETVTVTDPQAAFDNAPPLTHVMVRDRAVATSGGYRRGFEINGAHYSHIVDPRTGRPTGHVLSATVVAADASDAGALATALCVLTPEESARLSRQVPGAEYLLVMADGRQIESAGFRDLVSPQTRTRVPTTVATLHAAGQDTWDPAFALTIAITVGSPPGNRKRPYVVVWIEDAGRVPVRTLEFSHLRTDGTWDYKMKEWVRKDRQRLEAGGPELLSSVSSATRGPGVYTLTWDGKNDAGQLVKTGTYTVLIETMREGGTYHFMRQSMDFSGVAAKAAFEGNIELPAASLDYHRVQTR